jgi:hypothetical protein
MADVSRALRLPGILIRHTETLQGLPASPKPHTRRIGSVVKITQKYDVGIPAGHVILHEASTGNRLQLPLSRVPELVRRSMMYEDGQRKRPWQLQFRHYGRGKGNAWGDAQVDFSNIDERPPADKCRADHVPGPNRVFHHVVLRT